MNDFKVIKTDDALTILKVAWEITKKHYELILGVTLFMVAVMIAASWMPYLKYFASVPMIYLSVGQMFIVRQLIDGKPTKFADIFRAFEDQNWMNALLPLAISGVAIAFLQAGVEKVFEDGIFAGIFGALFGLALSLFWIALTAFSAPLIAFQNKKFVESVELNIKATTLNWKPLSFLALYMVGVVFVCAFCFVLPMFFIALPVVFTAGYLTYACMFEGLNIDTLASRVSRAPDKV